MYRHSVTLYDQNGNLKAKIRDAVNLNSFGFSEYGSQNYLGGPVEAVFSHGGQYLWVSQYAMVGEGFDNPGCDACSGETYDPGFVYKINVQTMEVENVIKVGSVPKFMAISEDESLLVVSNWTSGDVSIIDVEKEEEVRRVSMGPHPRGVAIKKDNSEAFVTVMGSTKIARLDLKTYEVSYMANVGKSPRHLILSGNDKYLYCSLNSTHEVVKINLETEELKSCSVGAGPRTMALSADERYLYVVNYFSNTFSKIETATMTVSEEVETAAKPIGICGNWKEGELWVACYSGSIEIFRDFELRPAEEDHALALNGGLKGYLEFDDFYVQTNSGLRELESSFKDSGEVVEDVDKEGFDSADKESVVASFISPDVALSGMEKTTSSLTPKADYVHIKTPDWVSIKLQEKEITESLAQQEQVSSNLEVEEETDLIEIKEEKNEPLAENMASVQQSAKIGMLSKEGRSKKTAKYNPQGCMYHVIVGSFSVPENATNLKADLEADGYPVTLIEGSELTYVSAQCYTDRVNAQQGIKNIEEGTGIKGWILKR